MGLETGVRTPDQCCGLDKAFPISDVRSLSFHMCPNIIQSDKDYF